MKIFINEKAVIVEPGATVGDAVRSFDPTLAEALQNGSAKLTDGVGRRIEESSLLQEGEIVRAIRSARRAPHTKDTP